MQQNVPKIIEKLENFHGVILTNYFGYGFTVASEVTSATNAFRPNFRFFATNHNRLCQEFMILRALLIGEQTHDTMLRKRAVRESSLL